MSYLNDGRYYICRYCKRKFPVAGGYNTSRLIMHLVTAHKDNKVDYKNLYLGDVIKSCFDCKRRANQ